MLNANPSNLHVVCFIIPIACRNFTSNWDAACNYLRQTIGSILNSIDPRFAVVIVGHESPMHYLPKDPRLHFLQYSESAPLAVNKNIQTIAQDWMGKMQLGRDYAKQKLPSEYVMRMDADDFLSNRVVGFLAQNSEKAAFRISDGWIWNSGARIFIQQLENFDKLWCGSSIILKSAIADLPIQIYELSDRMPVLDQAKIGSARTLFTNEFHSFADKALSLHGLDIYKIPFRAAIYRVGNINSVTGRSNTKTYSIRFMLGKIRRLRLMKNALRNEFSLF